MSEQEKGPHTNSYQGTIIEWNILKDKDNVILCIEFKKTMSHSKTLILGE